MRVFYTYINVEKYSTTNILFYSLAIKNLIHQRIGIRTETALQKNLIVLLQRNLMMTSRKPPQLRAKRTKRIRKTWKMCQIDNEQKQKWSNLLSIRHPLKAVVSTCFTFKKKRSLIGRKVIKWSDPNIIMSIKYWNKWQCGSVLTQNSQIICLQNLM